MIVYDRLRQTARACRGGAGMKYGVMQGVLGDPLGTVFATAASLGFDGVELDWAHLADVYSGGQLAPAQREQIRSSAMQAGVEITSVCAHFLNRGGLAHVDGQ